MNKSITTFALAALLVTGQLLTNVPNSTAQQIPVKNIVLVHGAFADGSGWKGIYDILTKKGYHVAIVQNPLSSLAADVDVVKSVIAAQDGPVILVGHSWAGAVITQAGVDPKVKGLVYIAAFMPDSGETAGKWVAAAPAAPEAGFTKPDAFGFVYFDPARFHSGFAADCSKAQSDFMCASQVPIVAHCFEEPVTQVAWKMKPAYGIIPTHDKALNPDTERTMYKRAHAKITEIDGSHVCFISHPDAVAAVIISAATNN